jgi:hypothetical protein
MNFKLVPIPENDMKAFLVVPIETPERIREVRRERTMNIPLVLEFNKTEASLSCGEMMRRKRIS